MEAVPAIPLAAAGARPAGTETVLATALVLAGARLAWAANATALAVAGALPAGGGADYVSS